MPRLLRPVILAAGVVLLGAQPASAAIWVRFDPPAARPGASVQARTVDASMVMITERRLDLFLIPRGDADRIGAVDDPRLTPIGELRGDRNDIGRLSFKVPDLPPGRYQTVAHCRSCDTTFTIGPFRIAAAAASPREASPEPQPAAGRSSWLTTAATGAALLLALASGGLVIAARGRRRRTP